MGKKKASAKKKKAAAAAASRGVVGPDYIQVLSGSLASKNITLILCGESHHDAIDVTRAGGGKIKEGWMKTDFIELSGEMVGKIGGIDKEEKVHVKCGMCKRNTKLLPLGKAKEWGTNIGHDEIDYIEPGREMALLWVPSSSKDQNKGRTYLVELFLDESSDDDQEDKSSSRAHLPPDVVDLLDSLSNATKGLRGVKSLTKAVQDIKKDAHTTISSHTLLVWSDLDSEARELNHRRLLGEDISTDEYDKLICDRKGKRRIEENLWTWDDWLVEVKSKLSNGNTTDGEDNPALHVVLESSIPPWEVELCRDLMPELELAQAADCIRCLSEDSDASDMDVFDPASDGFGSYMDFIYRMLLKVERAMHDGDSATGKNCLHCVDCRDLGCEHACVDDSLHNDWMNLLEPEEKERLLGTGPDATHAHHKDGMCLPDWSHSPEETELDRLRSSGALKDDNAADDQDSDGLDDTKETDLITFPSFESYFGQCTDILYYTPNYKVSYGPFLGKCVKSLDNWNNFFTELFFGGTVKNALSMLELTNNTSPYIHLRSPIMKCWNSLTGEYEWHQRNDEEHDLTLPILPIKSFLKARGNSPSRTWSSAIFASLLEGNCQELGEIATHARQWALDDIAKHCENPKLSDDEIGGGDWFVSYLRQCRREM